MGARLRIGQLVKNSGVGYSLDSNDVITEAEEFPLLRSFTGKRLPKAD
jgi:hypothetical protein